VGQKETPDDLAQSVCREVLERLAEHRLDYQGAGQFRQWLFQAALHKLQNRRRFYRAECRDAGREVAPAAGSGSASAPAWFAHGSSPSGRLMRREDLVCMEQALAALDESQRELIRWLRLEGRSHAEVAQRLGVTESHSRVLLARAMAKLGRLAQLAAAR
jgi:RNA polymerase sigma factor (sigma-70 family)